MVGTVSAASSDFPVEALVEMRREKRLLTSAWLLCLTMAVTGWGSCHSHRDEIAVIPRTTASTIWEAEHAGAAFAARKAGLRIRWNAPTREDDVRLQINMVDRAVAQRCRGLILTPDEPRALIVPVERALAAGVPTVVLGTALPIPEQRNLYYIVNDDEMIGRMAALRIGKVLDGKGEVAVVGIDPQSLSSLAVLRSFVSGAEQRFPNISIVDRRAGANNDLDSEVIVNQVLVSHPNLNAVVSLDAMGTIGSYLALKNRSLTHRVKVVGVQQSAELAGAIRLHQIDALIAQNTYQMGYRAVELLSRAPIETPRLIRLSPMLITADNVDSPEAERFITNDWRAEYQ